MFEVYAVKATNPFLDSLPLEIISVVTKEVETLSGKRWITFENFVAGCFDAEDAERKLKKLKLLDGGS